VRLFKLTAIGCAGLLAFMVLACVGGCAEEESTSEVTAAQIQAEEGLAEPAVKDWENLEVLSRNKEKPHCTLMPYESQNKARKCIREDSRYFGAPRTR